MEDEQIAKVINAVLDKRRGEDIEHKEHHAFVNLMIQREERKKEMWNKVKTQVLGWGIIAIVGSFGAWALSHITFRG